MLSHKKTLSALAVGLLALATARAYAQSSPAWFAMPNQPTLRASTKKVYAHYVQSFPLMIDFLPAEIDYYSRHYLSPNGESNKFLYCGGFLRDRPLPRSLNGMSSSTFERLNFEAEVRMAVAAGLDGFDYDLTGADDNSVARLRTMLDAAQEASPGFKIMLKPDMACEFGANPDALVPTILKVAHHPSLLQTDDGRLVLSPYLAESRTPHWWSGVIAKLRSSGVEVAFVPCVQGWQRHVDAFAPISDGILNWGNLDPYVDYSADRNRFRTFGNFVWPQNARPKSLSASEFGNSEGFRRCWSTAISQKVAFVDVATWNDFSESTHIEPSVGGGTAFLELNAYYTTWLKMGAAPKITRDALLYFHRRQSVSTPSTLPQRSQIVVGGGTDLIEALTFLTAPATVQVSVGNKTYTTNAPAGMNSFKVPLGVGTPTFRVIRSGRLVLSGKGQPILAAVDYQDMQYKAGVILAGKTLGDPTRDR